MAISGVGVASRIVTITNSRLANAVKALYRPGDTRAGGTAGWIREEATKGVYDAGHVQKAMQEITSLGRALGEGLSADEEALARALISDLQDAISKAAAVKK
jgi:hypothetical protein